MNLGGKSPNEQALQGPFVDVIVGWKSYTLNQEMPFHSLRTGDVEGAVGLVKESGFSRVGKDLGYRGNCCH